ncbi:unnamed protein product [Lepeophtheirus salmonis]|uniref:(salmon louse) hypothetical protein n=1 Tax=Lepeophtheirus salmonis TaxID=72036 RepID=A0A817FE62_LEPSM|nr:unnamed protein product [Lepeophtheirus salmonis]
MKLVGNYNISDFILIVYCSPLSDKSRTAFNYFPSSSLLSLSIVRSLCLILSGKFGNSIQFILVHGNSVLIDFVTDNYLCHQRGYAMPHRLLFASPVEINPIRALLKVICQ